MSRPSLVISVAELAALIRERLGVVVLVAAGVMGAVLAVGYGSELVFVARGQIFLGEASDAAAVDDGSARNDDGISGEIAILESASLIERATLAAGLNASIGPAARYSEWLEAGRDYAALPRADNELAISGATITGAEAEAYAVEFADAARYRVWSGATPLGEGQLGQPWAAGGLSWTLLEGPARRPRPGQRYEIVVAPAPLTALEASERLRVSAPRPSGSPHYGRIVALEFTAGSPHEAERFLAALLDAYVEHRHERKVGKLLAREAYLEGESRSVERALDAVERRLAATRASRRALWFGDEDNPLFAERERYRAAEARSTLEVARLSVYGEGLRGPAPPLATFLEGESNDVLLDALGKALAEAERELTEAEQLFADGAPELREHQARVADHRRAIERYVERRLGRARQHQQALGQLVTENDRKLDTLEQAQRELAELSRDQAAYADTYTRLLSQKGEAALVIAKAVSKDRIIDPPRAVAEPASPNLRQALSSGLFGLLLGVLGVLFRRLTASGVQAESDARRFLGDVPVLGAVPLHPQRRARRAVFADAGVHAAAPGHSAFEEAFRLLGMSLFGAQAEPRQQILFVTSPGRGDGKTTCALALGLALGRRGRRVLVVDGHPPELATLDTALAAKAETEAGLEDVLAGRCSPRAARSSVPAGSGQLHLLSAGRIRRDEARASAEQLIEFLQVARARYDVVLVDVPGHVPSNALAAIGLADRVLCVVRLRHTTRRALDDLLATLPHARTAALVVDERAGRERELRSLGGMPLGEEGPVASR